MRVVEDAVLVRRMMRGDALAFDELLERYQRRLLGYVNGVCGDPTASEDIVQETFLKLLRGLESYRERGRFRSYLFAMARNAALDHLRRRREEQVPDNDSSCCCAVAGDDAAADLDRAEDRRLLAKALDQLSEEQRDVILLRYFGELKFAAIAKLTGAPLGTALARCHYGLRKLRRLLTHELGGHAE